MIAHVLLVKDEIDIIERHLEENRRDLMIVTDNGSTDGTLEILKSKCLVLFEDKGKFLQNKIMDEMISLAFERGAKAVIPSDADEFWIGDIEKDILEAEGYDAISVPVINFKPAESNFEPYTINREWDGKMENFFNKPYPNKVILLRKLPISVGNHTVNGKIKDAKYTKIHHYPVRSYEQFEKKVINGGKTFKNDKDTAFHWKYWYQEYLKGNLRQEYEKLCN